MNPALLILNAGSSSLKFALYQAGPVNDLQAHYRGIIKEIGREARFRILLAPEPDGLLDRAVPAADHEQALRHLLGWLDPAIPV